MTQTWTIKSLLDWSQNYFQTKGIESARLDSELLLSHTLKLERMQLYLQFDRPLSSEELKTYKALIQRRSQLEPVAYILEEKEFFSRNFHVNPNVLIPRPDTEVLIEKILEHTQKDLPTKALEIGSGSGCIAVTLLCENPNLEMHAIDKSPEAITVTKQNAEQHDVATRLQTTTCDFLTDSQKLDIPQLDFIVSNPPYISEPEFQKIDAGIKEFEPYLALHGGDDGLNFYPAIAAFGKSHLKENGFVAVEMGEEQGPAVKKIFQDHNYRKIEIHKDYGNHDRVVLAWV